MSETLPPLPPPHKDQRHLGFDSWETFAWFSEDQMRAYAAAAVAAERERCAKLCEDDAYEIGAALAAAIRAQP